MERILTPDQIKEGYVRQKKLNSKLFALSIMLVMLTIAAEYIKPELIGIPYNTFLVLALIFLIILVTVSIRNSRCPACDKFIFLGQGGFERDHCQKCGAMFK